jgi:hypothetical protein
LLDGSRQLLEDRAILSFSRSEFDACTAPVGLELLQTVLGSPTNQNERTAIIGALGKCGNKRAVYILDSVAKCSDEESQTASMRALAKIGSASALGALLGLAGVFPRTGALDIVVDSITDDSARATMAVLNTSGYSTDVWMKLKPRCSTLSPRIAADLALSANDYDAAVDIAEKSDGSVGEEIAREVLINGLHRADYNRVIRATRAFAQMKSQDSVPELIACAFYINDRVQGDNPIRIAGAQALTHFPPSGEIIDALLQLVSRSGECEYAIKQGCCLSVILASFVR